MLHRKLITKPTGTLNYISGIKCLIKFSSIANKEELKQLLPWLAILIAINYTLTILLPFYLSFPLSLLALVLIIWHIIKNRTRSSQF
jgi:hypothetical protein